MCKNLAEFHLASGKCWGRKEVNRGLKARSNAEGHLQRQMDAGVRLRKLEEGFILAISLSTNNYVEDDRPNSDSGMQIHARQNEVARAHYCHAVELSRD